MTTPGLEQVTQTQTALEKGPISFVAALFAVSFFWLLWVHLRSKDKAFNAQLELTIKCETALTALAKYFETLPKQRHARKPRKSPEEVTAQAPPSEAPHGD